MSRHSEPFTPFSLTSVAKELSRDTVFEMKQKNRASRRCNSSYYCARNAAEVLPLLIRILRTQSAVLIPFKGFTISEHTLLIKIQQGWLYLIDRSDQQGILRELRSRMTIAKTKEGILLDFKQKELPKVATESEDAELKTWRDKIDTFVSESKPGEILDISGLRLSVSEIKGIHESFMNLPSFLIRASSSSIHILHRVLPST